MAKGDTIRHKAEIIAWKRVNHRIMVNYRVGKFESNVVFVDTLPEDTSNVEMILEDTGTLNREGKRVFHFVGFEPTGKQRK